MTNLRNTQLMEQLLNVLIKKIGNYTSRGFAANLIGKAIMSLRDENECLNNVLINETRYEEGINSFSISEDINYIDSYQFYNALKNLIKKTMEGFDNNVDIHFLNELRRDLPDIFYFIDNLDEKKYNKNKKQIMIVDNNKEIVDSIISGFKNISDEYEFTDANSGVQCFDLLTSGYNPEIIILNCMMPDEKGRYIFKGLKKNEDWNKIPVIFISDKNDYLKNNFLRELKEEILEVPFKVEELKYIIDEKLSMKNII